MWYIASLVRGMSVDEAIRQLKFVNKKGAIHVREVIEEAKELAVKEHNVEFGSNMWVGKLYNLKEMGCCYKIVLVAESFVSKGQVIKGMRRHGRARFGIVQYFHCHYFVRLEEGKFTLETFKTSTLFSYILKVNLQSTIMLIILKSPKKCWRTGWKT